MAQTLFVKEKDENGKDRLRPVKIIRAWQDADGRQVFLHHNGVYGYKDGSPVKSDQAFDLIDAPVQRKLAQAWWDKIGRRMSEEHYAQRDQEELERQTQGVPVVNGDSSELDMVLYRRRPLKGKRVFGDEKTWYACVEQRPDWWGQAAMIEIAGYRYERTELIDDAPVPDGDAPLPDADQDNEAVNF